MNLKSKGHTDLAKDFKAAACKLSSGEVIKVMIKLHLDRIKKSSDPREEAKRQLMEMDILIRPLVEIELEKFLRKNRLVKPIPRLGKNKTIARPLMKELVKKRG